MASIGTAYVDIEGNYGPLKKGAKRGVSPAAKVAGAAIAAGIGVALKGAIDEAREATKATAQTNAVIESTGGVAKVTAKELGNLANAISAKAGIDDEAIQSAGNLLLTFKDVRDEVGKNNDVFSQALPVITDMSVAMKQDLKSSTIQVGKALNDPIKGMTALQRVGVTFTQAQKNQVKALVESGDKMAAQKIILRELKSEFEGSAAAQADPFDKFKVAIDNLKESVGLALLPTLGKAADALSGFMDQVRSGKGLGGNFASGLRKVFGEISRVFQAGKKGFEGEQMLGPFKIPDNRTFVQKLADGIAAAMKSVDWGSVLDISEHISGGISYAFANIDAQAAAEQLTLILLKTFNTAMDPTFWMKHLDDVIVAALTFSKVGFLRKIPILGPILGKLGDFLWKGIGWALKGLGKLFGKLLWEAIEKAFSWLMRTAPKTAWKLGDFLGDVAVLGWRAVTSRFLALGSKIATAIGNGIVRAAGATGRAALNLLSKVWDAIRSTNVGRFGTWIASKIRDGVASLWKRFYSLGGFLLKKLKDGLINAPLNGLKSLGAKIGNAIQSGIGKVKAFVGIGGGIPLAGQLGHEKGGFGRVTALARGFGTFTGGPGQGYRPGDPGWHGKNRARDYSGGNMLGFAKAVASRFGSGLLELIHTPLGFGIKNGRRVPNSFFGSAVMADHYDHVHVAMRRGGKAGPGSGGPSVVYGEGKKDEWWISQEGDRKQNTRWGIEALESVSGSRVALFKKGGKRKAAARKVRIFNAKTEREDALDAAYTDPKYTVNLEKRLAKIDRLLKNRHLSRDDRNALLNMRGQVWGDLHPDAGEVTEPAEDPAVALAEAIRANTQAQAELAEEHRLNRDFAERTHTAYKSVSDKTLQAILDKTLGGQLSQMMLTLSPRMAT